MQRKEGGTGHSQSVRLWGEERRWERPDSASHPVPPRGSTGGKKREGGGKGENETRA